MSMTPHEQVNEAMHAVREAIEAVHRKGPLITRPEAREVGMLMKMTAPVILAAAERLSDGVDYWLHAEHFSRRRSE
jgi:hypothetical protein